MDILPNSLQFFLGWLFIALLWLTLTLNIFSLPANWLVLGLLALWQFAHPLSPGWGIWYWALLIGIAITGEVLEFLIQAIKARRYGSSTTGMFSGMIGAIIGAILLAPLFWGLGALIGALLGAFCGCYIMELAAGRPADQAFRAAIGAMLGRFLGTTCKVGLGALIIVMATAKILQTDELTPVLESAPEINAVQILSAQSPSLPQVFRLLMPD